MYELTTQISDVTYNPVDECFEALVTFHTDSGRMRIATRWNGPITTDLDEAAQALWHQACHDRLAPDALRARCVETLTVPMTQNAA